MSIILIKDLAESVELDREAMTAITGGARGRAPKAHFERTARGDSRIFSYPNGGGPQTGKGPGQSARTRPLK
jgi:hypothetical protein